MPSELNSILYMLIIFLGLFVVMTFGVIIFLVSYARRKAQVRKQLLEELNLHYGQGCVSVDVRYSTAERFQKTWKFFPWEGVGILVKSPQGIVFHGRSVLDAVDWQVEFEGAELFQYIGQVFWPNGIMAWMLAKAKDGTVHYFSSETGTFVLGSQVGTAMALLELK